LTLDPTKGHEQQGRRTFLVLTPKSYNEKTSLAVGCPITNKTKGYPFEVAVSGIAAVTGVVLADQVKSLDWRARQADFIASLDAATVARVRVYIKTLLRIT
jgi:mRNA interferase MazF